MPALWGFDFDLPAIQQVPRKRMYTANTQELHCQRSRKCASPKQKNIMLCKQQIPHAQQQCTLWEGLARQESPCRTSRDSEVLSTSKNINLVARHVTSQHIEEQCRVCAKAHPFMPSLVPLANDWLRPVHTEWSQLYPGQWLLFQISRGREIHLCCFVLVLCISDSFYAHFFGQVNKLFLCLSSSTLTSPLTTSSSSILRSFWGCI